MKVLLDSHALIWFVSNDAKLSASSLNAVIDPVSTAYVSPVSFWELAVKVSIGKLTLQVPFPVFVTQVLTHAGLIPLPVEASHAVALSKLPFHHRDPFDRMLVAQAMVEGTSMISRDPALDAYGVARIW